MTPPYAKHSPGIACAPSSDLLADMIHQVFTAFDEGRSPNASHRSDSTSLSFVANPAQTQQPAVRTWITPQLQLPDYSLSEGETRSGALNAGIGGIDEAAEPTQEMLDGIEGFEIYEEIGRGGMGTVRRARDRATGRIVAIKFLDNERLNSKVARTRFEREIRLAAQLEHPHIARIYDTGLADNHCYYVMEYVNGVPFDRHLRRYKSTVSETIALFVQICRAVEYAHRQGVIHRDLKPSNILIRLDGEPRIVDFGLAKSTLNVNAEMANDGLSIEGHIAGSPGFMAPEQAAGQINEVDQRSDVYALGAVLFKALTGEGPHDQSGPLYEVVRRIVVEPVRKPRSINPRIPRPLEAILLTALSKDKDDRYPTPAMLADDLEAYIQGKPLRANVMSRRGIISGLHHRVATVIWPLIALIVGLAIAAGCVLLYFQNQQYQRDQEAHRESIEEQLDSLRGTLNAEAKRQGDAVPRSSEGNTVAPSADTGPQP